MALSIRSLFEDLQYRLAELHERGYYYVGETVFAGTGAAEKKVNVKGFHLWDVSCRDELERIVMLFLDLSMRNAATVVIEGSRVYVDESTNVRFQIDCFQAMRAAVDVKNAKELECRFIRVPTRLIYPQPLFLPLLYRHNLILEGHNFFSLCGDGAERRYAEEKKNRLMLENIRQELRDYFELDSWEEREYFRDHSPVHDDLTRRICEMSRCLEGLQKIYKDLSERDMEEDNKPGSIYPVMRLQRIGDMVCVAKSRLQELVQSAGRATPIANPVHTIALWHLEEHFPENMTFGEMVHIRAELGNMRAALLIREPKEETNKTTDLWYLFGSNVERQIQQIDSLLAAKLEENGAKWEGYLA